MKKLEENVDIELGINEALDCTNHGNDYLRYAGMPSRDRFALTEIDGTGGRFLNQLFFPAWNGYEMEIHTFTGGEKNIRVFRVENVNERKIVLRYLGMR